MEARRKWQRPFFASLTGEKKLCCIASENSTDAATLIAVSAPYFTLVREMKDAFNHRLRRDGAHG